MNLKFKQWILAGIVRHSVPPATQAIQLPEDWFGTPTWPPFHCFGTPIWPPWRHVKTLYIFVTLATQPSEVSRSRLSKREHCPQRKRLKNTHVRVSLSCVHVNQKKKKTGSRGTRSVLPSFSPIPSFNYSNYPVDLSVYLSSATPRISWELKTKNTLKTRLRVVPHFSSGTVERAKREREKGESRWGERKMRDYRQSPSFWPFTADRFWSVKFVSHSKSIKRIQWDSFPPWAVIAHEELDGVGNTWLLPMPKCCSFQRIFFLSDG